MLVVLVLSLGNGCWCSVCSVVVGFFCFFCDDFCIFHFYATDVFIAIWGAVVVGDGEKFCPVI